MSSLFFRPPSGWVGDVIPFHDGETFQLFYLHDRRDPAKPGTSWNRVATSDFVNWRDHGVAIQHGEPTDEDLNAYTGSVIEHDGVAHCFYTGYNPDITDERGTPIQWVMHATSDDGMRTWTKVPDDTFRAPTEGYDVADWRDPFVYRLNDDAPWQMLLAARTTTGPERRRGVVARLESHDLQQWEPVAPLWAPNRYVTQECPDLFTIGDWWYLMYSEFSDAYTTRYVMARTPEGPWTTPRFDTVDGRGFYAAKTAAAAESRYAFGWIPSRVDERDDGDYQWAGSLAVHALSQQADGTLAVSLPTSIQDAHARTTQMRLTPVLGSWSDTEEGFTIDVRDGAAFASAVTESPLPNSYLLSTVIDIRPDTHEVGVMFRTDDDGDAGYIIRLEPQRNRMVFDRWPRPITGELQWQISGDVPHFVELERAVDLRPGRHTLQLLVEHDTFIAYLDGTTAMSGRAYDRLEGRAGVFVAAGAATFTHPTISTR